jgi:hypothetical protein
VLRFAPNSHPELPCPVPHSRFPNREQKPRFEAIPSAWLDQNRRLDQPRIAEDVARPADHRQLFHRQKVACGEDIGSQLIEFDVGVRGSEDNGSVTIASGLKIFH